MTNETDNFFKTALDGLPDAPPSGAAFDAEALWNHLDRELRPRKRLRDWWVAAACGLLLLAGLGWWGSFSEEKPAVPTSAIATRNGHQRTEPPEKSPPAPSVSQAAAGAERPTVEPKSIAPRPATVRQGPDRVAVAPPAAPEPAPVAPPAPEISPEPVAEAVAATLVKPVFSEKKTARSKPRFRVVHANELPSSETIPMKQPRTEATARVTLGFPSALQAVSAETPHVLILTKKPD